MSKIRKAILTTKQGYIKEVHTFLNDDQEIPDSISRDGMVFVKTSINLIEVVVYEQESDVHDS